MGFEVVITQAALNDLEEIVAYINQDSPRAAKRMADNLINRAQPLSAMPRKGQVMRTRSMSGVWFAIHISSFTVSTRRHRA